MLSGAASYGVVRSRDQVGAPGGRGKTSRAYCAAALVVSAEHLHAAARAFGLTSAEVRLAGLIAEVQPLNAAAARQGIGDETARSQLKSIYARTGSTGQASLVGLLILAATAVNICA